MPLATSSVYSTFLTPHPFAVCEKRHDHIPADANVLGLASRCRNHSIIQYHRATFQISKNMTTMRHAILPQRSSSIRAPISSPHPTPAPLRVRHQGPTKDFLVAHPLPHSEDTLEVMSITGLPAAERSATSALRSLRPSCYLF